VLAQDESLLQSGTESWASADRSQCVARVEALRRFSNCEAVGHRFVHGGLKLRRTVLLDAAVREQLDALVAIDPLHMRPALWVADAVSTVFPDVPQYAAFDTAFHATLSEAAAGYGIPQEWTERWGLRRFGFHGLSVAYSVGRAREMLRALPERVVVCHLGSGCSMTAVRQGRSVDTTMGFTPLEGLMMGTRSGSVDPGLLLYLLTTAKMTAHELADALNHRAGLLGVSGLSADMRQIIAAAAAGSGTAALAYNRFILYARRALGAMLGALGGVELLIFTGGIGENSARVRRDIALAVNEGSPAVDAAANESANEAGVDVDITASGGDTRVLLIHAREDLVILRELLQAPH